MKPFIFCLLALLIAVTAHAGEKALRVGFGDNRCMPIALLKTGDLVCSPSDLGLGTNNPEIRITKFTDTSKMTPAEIARRQKQGFNWICYDNENGKDWPTPQTELADPTKNTILAAQRAHAAGMKFIAEPNFELITGRGSRGQDGKLILTDKKVPFVRLAEVAPYLDAISLQLQRAQLNRSQYRELTRRYATQVRAANPRALIFVQVTSREKSGKKSSPIELMADIRDVAEFVDGIWIHVDKDEEKFATELVTLMDQVGYR